MSNYLSPYRKLIICAKWALFSNPITYGHYAHIQDDYKYKTRESIYSPVSELQAICSIYYIHITIH